MITIPDSTFGQILSVLGYPFVTVAPDSAENTKGYDLELSSKQIKDLIIEPALQEYYRWFPIETYTTQSISSEFEIPFPNEDVFSVKDVRLSGYGSGYGGGYTGNALIDTQRITSMGRTGRGMYGTRNDYGFSSARISVRSENQSAVESRRAFKWRVLENQRKVVGFSNVVGTLEITWAARSSSWEYVAFSQQSDVVKLCQGKVLEYFGRLRQQLIAPDSPAELNGEILIERSKELLEQVYEKWKNFSVPIIMRG
ncbi:MAG TPA: hypothetical protein VFD28_02470 [Candidatus Eisenbacteria bacterium]|nr:hypothetical protein [Candidatus Eisenbacteria bacterium]